MEEGSHRDPICGMIGRIEKHGHWFCSDACITRYEANLRSSGSASALISLLKDPILWSFLLVAGTLAAGSFWSPLEGASERLLFYLSKAGWAVVLGLFLGGVIDRFIPKEYISLMLSGKRRRVILTSAGLGFLASSCSHGCLALSMELHRKGASPAAVITFLLASPWASLPMTLLILSLLGWKGLLIVVTALLIALASGLLFQRIEGKGWLEKNPNTVEIRPGFSVWEDLKTRFRQHRWDAKQIVEDLKGIGHGALGLARMVLIWVALGFTLSAVLGTAVPEMWWHRFFGPSILGLASTMGVAALIEVCSEGTAPLGVELYRQTGALGNAFAFLMGGVVTDITELSLLRANLGKRVTFWYLVVTLPQVFLFGILMNLWVR